MIKWEKCEDTTGVISSRKSKGRQHQGKAKNHKMTNNTIWNSIQKTNDRATWTPLKNRGPDGLADSARHEIALDISMRK